jgi:hypothetical protein
MYLENQKTENRNKGERESQRSLGKCTPMPCILIFFNPNFIAITAESFGGFIKSFSTHDRFNLLHCRDKHRGILERGANALFL